MKKILCMILALVMVLSLVPAAFAEAAAREGDVKASDMIGTLEGKRYENKALGIGAEIPETWQVFSPEEATRLMYDGFDLLEADSDWLARMLEENESIFDLYTAAMDNSGDNINIQVQKSAFNLLQKAVLTEEKLIEASMEEVEKSLKDSGLMDEVKLEMGSCEFAGKTHACLDVSGTMYGVPVYERMVMLLKGDYMGVVTGFSLDKDALAKNFAMFTAA